MSDYQLIVIGAGPGGYTAALRAAKLGGQIALGRARTGHKAMGEHNRAPIRIAALADIVHELRTGLVAAGEQAAGLDAGQGGRALADNQFIGHMILPFLWSVCADPVGLYSEIS